MVSPNLARNGEVQISLPKLYMNAYYTTVGGGFQIICLFLVLGEMIQFDEHVFQMGWNNLA